MTESRTVHCLIRGRVQGVGFRYATQREADRLGLKGWVRNTADGSVEAVISGPAADVGTMIEWLHHGPRFASVASLTSTNMNPDPNLRGFEIRA